MENELAKIDYTQKATIDLLKATVAKGATDTEFQLFCSYCQSTGLNPLKKEVWFIKVGTQLQLMTGINGFYTIANSHPQFDGIEVETIDSAEGKLIKSIAKVYRKDRSHPVTAEAYLEEYAKPHGTWKTMPRVMLSKCAESMALRKAFPQELNGLYTTEEMPANFAHPKAEEFAVTEESKTVKQEKPSEYFYYDISDVEIDANLSKYLHEATSAKVAEVFNTLVIAKRELKKLSRFLCSKAQADLIMKQDLGE